MSRVVCQFSCGAASAVATKLTLAQHPDRADAPPECGLMCEMAEQEYAA